MSKSYPEVLTETETLSRVLAGVSIARFGDGEFKHCADQANVSQEYDPMLSAWLRKILLDSGRCMVGIPNLNPYDLKRMSPEKSAHWSKYAYASRWLDSGRSYGSAFISRPDSAPWINEPAYWKALESLWLGQDVTLVRGSSKGLTSEDLVGAGMVTEIYCKAQHSFADFDTILARIGTPKRALLCLGPTATVLAVELCARGVHAIDLGHVAMFLRKYRRGEPMTLTKDEKNKAAV